MSFAVSLVIETVTMTKKNQCQISAKEDKIVNLLLREAGVTVSCKDI